MITENLKFQFVTEIVNIRCDNIPTLLPLGMQQVSFQNSGIR
jgi:hypothetical protein